MNDFRHRFAVIGLSIFFALSPILVYAIGPLHNTFLLEEAKKQVAAIPSYSSATLVESSFTDKESHEYTERYCTWGFKYDVGNQREALISHYQMVLPALGWTSIEVPYVREGYYAYYYSKPHSLLAIGGSLQESNRVFISITYTYSVQFDLLRYRP